MVDALVSNTSDFTVVRVRVSLPAHNMLSSSEGACVKLLYIGALFSFFFFSLLPDYEYPAIYQSGCLLALF